jgi:NADPH-dependent glutamate synthase beta subunit-like oxidoreductase
MSNEEAGPRKSTIGTTEGKRPYAMRFGAPYRPDPANPDAPGPASKGEPRGSVLRLGQKITDRIGHTVSTSDPEYWGLASFVDDEMAAVANHMRRRRPMTLAQIEKACGKDADELLPILERMSVAGLLEYNWENDAHEKQWMLPMFVPGSAEFSVMNERQLEEHPELATFFERMSRLPLEKVTPMVPPGGAGVGMHVIPVERAIEHENVTADVEHISHWLKKYDTYAASACSCRLSEAVRGDGCGDDAEDWCIGVGDVATYSVETGKGRYVTYDEVMEILRRAEANGFVHQITNIDGSGKIFAICNCNVNVCYALRTSQLFNTPNMSRSAYVARVDAEQCVACGGCVEHCPAGAVKLGQKLCRKDGPVSYPKQELPDAAKWGPEKWDEDYKDTARIECYETGTAPCKVACPAHIAIQGYLKLAAQGDYAKALAVIKKKNPFPAVCGRVCNRPCEEACTRGTVDEAIAIDDVKRFIADQDLDAATRYVPPVVQPSLRGPFKQKIAIVGAGPAGLTCAFYLAQMGYSPTVFERDAEPGGMLTYGIPAYKLDKDVVKAEIDVIREMGVTIRCGIDVGADVTLDELRAEGFKAFYLAIGCQGGKRPGIPGENAAGVEIAVDFLRKVLGGTETDLEGKRVVVVGGGNVAIDVARSALRAGAASATMRCLESRDDMPASPEEIAEAEAEGVVIECGWGPKEILASDSKLTGISFKRCTRVFDDEHHFSPAYDESDVQIADADRVVLAIGQAIEWGSLIEDEGVTFSRGYAPKADPRTYQTDQPDVFVGGDVYTGPRFVIDAIAAGHEAAISLHRFVQPNSSLTIGRDRLHYVELDKTDLSIGEYDTAKRQVPATRPDVDPRTGFVDARLDLTEEQVRTETARCLGCGAAVVDENKCIGCGVCTTMCGFDAIHLHRDHPECSTMIKAEDKMKAVLPYAIKREVKIRLGQKR